MARKGKHLKCDGCGCGVGPVRSAALWDWSFEEQCNQAVADGWLCTVETVHGIEDFCPNCLTEGEG